MNNDKLKTITDDMLRCMATCFEEADKAEAAGDEQEKEKHACFAFGIGMALSMVRWRVTGESPKNPENESDPHAYCQSTIAWAVDFVEEKSCSQTPAN